MAKNGETDYRLDARVRRRKYKQVRIDKWFGVNFFASIKCDHAYREILLQLFAVQVYTITAQEKLLNKYVPGIVCRDCLFGFILHGLGKLVH